MRDKLYEYTFKEVKIETCSDCPCCQGYGTDACCGIEMKGIDIQIGLSKPTWCPLVESEVSDGDDK